MEAKETTLSDIAYFSVDVQSHVVPFRGFLAELEANGLKFDTYGSSEIVKGVIGQLGQNHFEFEDLTWKKEEGISGWWKCGYQSHLKTIPEIEEIWKEKKCKPKLIIADMVATYAKFLAKKHDIPLLVLYSSYFFANLLDPWKEDLETELLTPRDDSFIPLEKEVEENYGVRINTSLDMLIQGDHNISCLPKFAGDLLTLGKDNFTYVGPILRDESKSEIPDVDPTFLEGNDLIYVSLGTTQPNIEGFSFYDTIIEALKDTEHKVLISATMGKAEELIAKGLPKNIIAKSWVPQIKVLEHSKLFISHVGAGGMMEAMSKGVPIIAVPTQFDQPLNASVVEKLKLGRWLHDKSPENTKKVVAEVLNDDIKECCLKYKLLMNPQASKEKFIDIVRSLLVK